MCNYFSIFVVIFLENTKKKLRRLLPEAFFAFMSPYDYSFISSGSSFSTFEGRLPISA